MKTYNFCFVVIGFGTKPSYATGVARMLDLNQTYSKLIKPVFDELGIKCQRACDMNVSGSIDQVMIKAINESDIVICDITCLNANAIWELGVRHALKKCHTIIISDWAHLSPTPPFDVSHHVIQGYQHSPDGITDEEAERFKKVLKNIVENLENNLLPSDSPVYDILDPNKDPMFGDKDPAPVMEPFSALMARAEAAKRKKDWKLAISLFDTAKSYVDKNLAPKSDLPFIECRRALCTYKSDDKDMFMLAQAMAILTPLAPKDTQDVEILGLSGAINKRIFELNANPKYLEEAIWYYDRGFSLKQDYYNGINAAYMLYRKASIQKANADDEWEDTRTDADSTRNKVLKVSLAIEAGAGFAEQGDRVWVLFTIAEAYNYKGDTDKQTAYEQKAKAEADAMDDSFAISAYEDQKAKIETIKQVLAQ
ncbi:MAG TPA: hypothetical protein PKM63_07300 [Panacibacter sp.]|nr:hypothetical protein [Panacibacter sp.]HNP44075.1 hypothetical protein [Panacibacter sp.]